MEPGPFDSLLNGADVDKDLVKFARDAACAHGLVINPPHYPPHLVTPLPIALLPSPLPRAAYLQAVEVQTHFNSLIDRVSQDKDFLEEALASAVEVDDFTAQLFNIYKQIQREEKQPIMLQDHPKGGGNLLVAGDAVTCLSPQSVVLGLNRCDYMVDRASALKQVEVNTFAAGLGGVAGRMVQLHRDVLRVAGRLEESRSLVDSDAAAGQMRAMAKAWELYGSERAVVLLLDSKILCDHRFLEYELLKRSISVIHRTFEDVISSGYLDHEDRLFVDSREVAVVYFRYGYGPQHYPSQQFWNMRLMMERSRAVKCPDIASHLAGTKKVQQVLSEPGALERFFPGQPHVVQQLRATFTGLYSLAGPEGDSAVEMALAAPERFVLKPQREGGGNNLFGSDICPVLERASDRERSAYILMDKIECTPSPNVLLLLLSGERPPVVSDCTNELGVFGAYVRCGGDLVLNEVVGHVIRTKMAADSECGLCAGTAGLGSLFLL